MRCATVSRRRWVALVAVLAVVRPFSALGLLAVTLGVWLIAGSVTDLARRAGSLRKLSLLPAGAWSVALAHAGLGVVALGVAGTAVWKSEAIAVLAPGQSMNIAGYSLRLDSTQRVEGYRNFATKLWNATRFAGMNGCKRAEGFDPHQVKLALNRWAMGELARAIQEVTQAIEVKGGAATAKATLEVKAQ